MLELKVAALTAFVPRVFVSLCHECLAQFLLSKSEIDGAVAAITTDAAERAVVSDVVVGLIAEVRALLSPALAELAVGDEALRRGVPAEALAIFDEALVHIPNDFTLLHRRCVALMMMGQIEEALATFDRALEPDTIGSSPRREGLLRAVRADCLRMAGRNVEALKESERALHMIPGDVEPHLAQARALRALGRFEDAIDGYDRILAHPPDDLDRAAVERERASTIQASLGVE